MENKKTKLTISGSPKKSFKNFDLSKNQNKKTVVIDKQKNKPSSKGVHNKTLDLDQQITSKKIFIQSQILFPKHH